MSAPLFDPKILYRILSLRSQIIDEAKDISDDLLPSPNLKLPNSLLDILAAILVNCPEQSVVVAASTLKKNDAQGVETTLYITSSFPPPDTFISFLVSVLAALKNISEGPRASESVTEQYVDSLCQTLYSFGWKYWEHCLRGILDNFDLFKEVNSEDTTRQVSTAIEDLYKVFNEGDDSRIPLAMSKAKLLYEDWDRKGFLTSGSLWKKQPPGVFALSDRRVREKFGKDVPFHRWLSKIVAFYPYSMTLVKLAQQRSIATVFQGSLNIVLCPLASPSLVDDLSMPEIDKATLETIMSHVRQLPDVYYIPLKSLIYLDDRENDQNIRDFISWACSHLESFNDPSTELHPQCELSLLSYLHDHSQELEIYPYLGTSQSTCQCCMLQLSTYYDKWSTGLAVRHRNFLNHTHCMTPLLDQKAVVEKLLEMVAFFTTLWIARGLEEWTIKF